VLPHYGDCPDCGALPEFLRRQKAVYRAKSVEDWKEVLSDESITVKLDQILLSDSVQTSAELTDWFTMGLRHDWRRSRRSAGTRVRSRR
jgi:hypothetical protein